MTPDTTQRTPVSTGTPLPVTLDEARHIAIAAQQLNRPRRRGQVQKSDLLDTIKAIGCVQLDTISVVARSHETVLWSRLGAYDPAHLQELHFPDGELIEYWAHAAALTPTSMFRYFRRMMEERKQPDSWTSEWLAEHAGTVDHVLAAIHDEGPRAARHFERPSGPRPEPWTWWGGKPARQALDLLWTRGDLMILRRDGFQRIYELTDRLAPHLLDGDLPTEAEQRRYFVTHALRALGVATPHWVADYFRTGGRAHVPLAQATAELRRLEAEGIAIPIDVPGVAAPTWLDASQCSLLDELHAGRAKSTRTTLLSPFDNLIWHRGRTESLFNFEYRLECYTPAPKRRYGYYNLPILHRGRLVGRLDPVYSRKNHVLTVKSLHLEPGVRVTGRLLDGLAATLRDYNAFLGGGDISITASNPPEFRAALQSQVDNA
ncbi:MAG TPA: crosslink repair DNA glycosylase YcaQ family protein [Thermomicrobiales bacterium]|nr:crosslink repair DNA glycosylase YcaQ family protein [Thermomicrobiales bacterium]